MSRKEQKVKLNSPKVNSELLTTLSSFTNPINQTTLSSNSKESKIQQNNSHLKCTCNHKMAKTFQKTQLKCTCKVYKNTNTNNMGSYKIESRESRFDQITTPVKNNKTNINTGISEQNSFRSQSYKKDTFMSASNDSRLVCTCKHLKNSNANIRRVYSEKKMGLYLWGQKTENLQILSSPAPELTTQYVQNLAIIQNSKPINILVPAIKNEIAYTNKIQIEGLSKEEAKEISEEKKEEEVKVETEKIEEKNEQEAKEEENEQEEKEEKEEEEEEEKEEKEEKEEIIDDNNEEEAAEENNEEENEESPEENLQTIQEEKHEEKTEEKEEEKEEVKEEENIVVNDDYNKVKKTSYSRRIRANIIRLQPKEDTDREDSSISDYDVLQKITIYEGDFKYKNLVNQSLELIGRQSSKSSQKINIKTPSSIYENQEKTPLNNLVHFSNKYVKENKETQINQQQIFEVPYTPNAIDNSPDIIQDNFQAPEDSPYPGELVSNNKLNEDNEDNEIKEQNNNYEKIEKIQTKNINMNNLDKMVSPIQKDYINMKIEESGSRKVELNQEEEKSQDQEEIKENTEDNNNIDNEQQNEENEKESENEHDVETYEIEDNMEKNENNQGDMYFYNELELGNEEKEKMDEENENMKNHLTEEHESLEKEIRNAKEEKNNEEINNENENENVNENESDENIEEQLGLYVEEQQNKKLQEKMENERKRKIKVYNLVENKNLEVEDENNESNSIIVCIKSSVKKHKKNKIVENSPDVGNSSSDGLDIEPKNSVVKQIQ